MKTLIARLAVVTLAATGFAASTVVSQAHTKKVDIAPIIAGGPLTNGCGPDHCGY